MHEKALTTDNLDTKGWENNVICPLYLEEAETNHHLLIDCPFAMEVIQHIGSLMEEPDIQQRGQGTDTVHRSNRRHTTNI